MTWESKGAIVVDLVIDCCQRGIVLSKATGILVDGEVFPKEVKLAIHLKSE